MIAQNPRPWCFGTPWASTEYAEHQKHSLTEGGKDTWLNRMLKSIDHGKAPSEHASRLGETCEEAEQGLKAARGVQVAVRG